MITANGIAHFHVGDQSKGWTVVETFKNRVSADVNLTDGTHLSVLTPYVLEKDGIQVHVLTAAGYGHNYTKISFIVNKETGRIYKAQRYFYKYIGDISQAVSGLFLAWRQAYDPTYEFYNGTGSWCAPGTWKEPGAEGVKN